MPEYTKEKRSNRLKEVRDRQREAHERAREILVRMGFTIEKDIGAITSKPWDFIAKKHGLTYFVDAKSPYTAKGQFKISVNEMVGMLDLRAGGVPAYLFILPDGRTILFAAT